MRHHLSRRAGVVALVALAGPTSAVPSEAVPPRAQGTMKTGFKPGAPGVGDPCFPRDGNGGYDVRRYVLDLRYQPATGRLSGVATIKARAT